MDDIEDLQVGAADQVSQSRVSVLAPLVAMNPASAKDTESHAKGNAPYLPGNQNVFLKVWGCSHNVSDKEYMAGILQDYGYHIVNDDSNADVAILVSCTVKNPSEGHFLTYLDKLREKGVKVIAAGCVPQGEIKHPKLVDVSLIGTQQIDRIVEVLYCLYRS
jgi:threonylcarbamoyladenosine tRNA methylthiotransferase CDKAL1